MKVTGNRGGLTVERIHEVFSKAEPGSQLYRDCETAIAGFASLAEVHAARDRIADPWNAIASAEEK